MRKTTRWIKRAAVARRLGIAASTVDSLVKQGALPQPHKFGPHIQSPVLFDEDEVETAIEKLMRDSLKEQK
jgi:predicted DNA-binding transcriptional regulator AlpA